MKLKFNINTELEKKEVENRIKIVLFDCMVKMHALANQYCPVDTGRLKTSIHLDPTSPGYASYKLVDGVDYGINVEYGTKPHYVSASMLKGWSRRVLGSEGAAVAKNISKYGVEAQPFFRPSLDQVKQIWLKRYWKQEFSKG
jgi:hypothetical protein